MDVTEGPVFLLLGARSNRRRLIPNRYAGGKVTVPLLQLLLGRLKQAELLDANGVRFCISATTLRGIDIGAYRPFGLGLGILAFVLGLLTFTCFVRVSIRLQYVETLPLERAKEWVDGLVRESPASYTHLPQGNLLAKISKARSLKSLISSWHFD